MAKPILVANWKNYPGSLPEAKSLLTNLAKSSRLYKKISLFIAPPLPYLGIVAERSTTYARLACQDFPSLSDGTHTGMVLPNVLKSFGVRLAVIGHSERRALGETSEDVAEKVKIATNAGIIPLVCIGEETRDSDGDYFEFLREEIKLSLSGISKKADAEKLIIAYEPIWAIGSQAKGVIEPTDLAQTVIFIRKVLSDIFGRATAENIPVLYGGSVDAANAEALVKETGIKGFLVGRASLRAESFKAIAESLVGKK